MTNLVEVKYARTGKSSNTDALGMREMQAMVYAQRNQGYVSDEMGIFCRLDCSPEVESMFSCGEQEYKEMIQ